MIPHRTRSALAAGLAAAALGACSRRQPAAPPAAAEEEGPRIVIPADRAAALLADSGVVVLHVDRSRNAYDAGHLPGARFLPLGAIVVEREGLPNELPVVTALDSVFESLGVGDSTRVVIYGDPLWAARAWFTLDYLGHGEHASVLDGGLVTWRAGGHPVTRDAPPSPPRAERFTPRPQPALVVDAAWVASRLPARRVAVLDARPAEEFAGEKSGEGVRRPGHITGAANLFWRMTLAPGAEARLLPEDSLRALFTGAGAARGDTVVTYCRTGVQASHLYLVARHLGYVVRMYDASYLDWSRREALPVEEGARGSSGG